MGRRVEGADNELRAARSERAPEPSLALPPQAADLPAPVAFAAALIGGALGGILFAFLALPVAGVMLAAVRTYGRYYEVVEDDKTVVPALVPQRPAKISTRRRSWFSWRHQDPPGSRDGEAPLSLHFNVTALQAFETIGDLIGTTWLTVGRKFNNSEDFDFESC